MKRLRIDEPYNIKGFALDDERLKNPDQPFDYFEELTTMSEVIPVVTSLSHADKLKLMQLILEQFVREDAVAPQDVSPNQKDPLFGIIGIAEGEDDDVARRHDHYFAQQSSI